MLLTMNFNRMLSNLKKCGPSTFSFTNSKEDYYFCHLRRLETRFNTKKYLTVKNVDDVNGL